MTRRPPSPAALLRAAKRACQDARDGRVDEALLRSLADAGEALAVAACAQVALFRGDGAGAFARAARYVRAPSPRATSNLFVDMCCIIRASGDASAVAAAVDPPGYPGLVEGCLRTDGFERSLLRWAEKAPAPGARAAFAAALEALDGRPASARGTDGRVRREVRLAYEHALDDELLRRHEERPDLFDWNATLEVAFALLRAGDRAGAARALDADPRRWFAVDAGQVVPVELATHPALAGLWTPARAAYWLASPRGA